MLGLPQSTVVKRSLPKAQLYKRFDWKPSQRDSFDGDVARLDFVHWIAPRTLPAIAEGANVKEIYVVEVALKKRDFDSKNIALLAKSIPQRVVYQLRYEDEAMLAVYYVKLFTTDWKKADDITLQLSGLNLDAVWEVIVRQIGNIPPNSDTLSKQAEITFGDEDSDRLSEHVGTSLLDIDSQSEEIQHSRKENPNRVQHPQGMSLKAQIEAIEERAKIQRQIESLERQMRTAKQPRRKRELFNEIQKLRINFGV